MTTVGTICAWANYWHWVPQSHDQDCGLTAVQRTLCIKHYHRLEYYGLKGVLPPPYTNGDCGLFFCDTPTFNGDFCRRHGWFREYGIHSSVINGKIEEQFGCCAICDDWNLDHSHLCNLHDPSKMCPLCVRGVLCPACNKGIGLLGDLPTRIRAHIAYLDRYSYDVAFRDDSPASAHDRSKNPNRICIEANCLDQVRARGLCAHHWHVHHRNGDLDLFPKKTKTTKRNNYLWSKHLLAECDYLLSVANQDNRCANLDCLATSPGGPGEWHIDHDHHCVHTGMRISCLACRRGLLCSNCNTGSGCFDDDPVLLRKAASYLDYWGHLAVVSVFEQEAA